MSDEMDCDVCSGTGKPVSGLPCICGGTGSNIDEKVGLRRKVHEMELQNDQMRKALEEIRDTNQKPGWYQAAAQSALVGLAEKRKDDKPSRYGWSSDPQTDADLQAKYGDSVHRPKHEGERGP